MKPASIDARLEAALDFAHRRLPVIPIRPDKRPFTLHGVKDATTDEKQIRAWAEQWPGCNWGMATGEPSGIDVLDIDPRNGGNASMQFLNREYGKLPVTVCVLTGGEEPGWHYYFRHPEGRKIKNKKIKPGIDVKTTGGYVIIPPSVTHQAYKFAATRGMSECRVADMPGWMIGMASVSHREFDFDETGLVPTGSRNDFIASLGGSLRYRGMNEQAIYDMIVAAGKVYCEYDEDVDDEYRRVASSMAKYSVDDPILKPGPGDLAFDVRVEARESERIILGYLMSGKDEDGTKTASAMSELRSDFFDDETNRKVYRAERTLWQQGATVSRENVISSLTSTRELGVGPLDEDYLRDAEEVGRRIVYDADLKFHIDLLRKAYLFREGSRVLSQSLAQTTKGSEEPKQIIATAAGRLLDLVDAGAERRIYNSREINEVTQAVLKSVQEGQQTMNTPTGWPSLDREIIGWPNSEVTIIAARPGMGKTAKVIQAFKQCANGWKERDEQKCAVMFSAEMSVKQIGLRLLSGEAKINSQDLRRTDWWKTTTPDEHRRIQAAYERLEGLNYYVDDTPSPTPEYITSKVMSINAHTPVGLIVFDYLELIGDDGRMGKREFNKVLQLERALVALKAIAKMLDIPVIVLCQLSRDVEKRATKGEPPIPRPSDLRWAGMAEQIANIIIMLYYPWGCWYGGFKYADGEPDIEYYEEHIQKSRDGGVGVLPFRFVKQYGEIVDIGGAVNYIEHLDNGGESHPSDIDDDDLPWE